MIEFYFLNESKDGWDKVGSIDAEEGEIVEDNTEEGYLNEIIPDYIKKDRERIMEKFSNPYINTLYVPDEEFEKSNIRKERVYVDDISDVPEWAEAEEGPQDGIYYVVGEDEEGQSRLGGIPDDRLDRYGEYMVYTPENVDVTEIEEGQHIAHSGVLGDTVGEVIEERDSAIDDKHKIVVETYDGDEESLFVEEDDDIGFVVEEAHDPEVEGEEINDTSETIQTVLPNFDDHQGVVSYTVQEKLPDRELAAPAEDYARIMTTMIKAGVDSEDIVEGIQEERGDIDASSDRQKHRLMKRALGEVLRESTKRDVSWSEASASYKSNRTLSRDASKLLESKNPEAKEYVDDKFDGYVATWERYGDVAAFWQIAEDMVDHRTNKGVDHDEHRDVDPFEKEVDEEEMELAEEAVEHTQEILRELYGDEMLVYRGINLRFASDINTSDLNRNDTISIEHQTLASWSTNPSTASMYGSGEDGLLLKQEIPVENVLLCHLSSENMIANDELGVALPERQEYDLSEGEAIILEQNENDKHKLPQALDIIREDFGWDSMDEEKEEKERNVHELSLEDYNPYWLTELREEEEENED